MKKKKREKETEYGTEIFEIEYNNKSIERKEAT